MIQILRPSLVSEARPTPAGQPGWGGAVREGIPGS